MSVPQIRANINAALSRIIRVLRYVYSRLDHLHLLTSTANGRKNAILLPLNFTATPNLFSIVNKCI